MLFAKVVLGLPLHTAFDYLIPEPLEKKTLPGMRVCVPFRNKKLVGYIIGISKTTTIKNVRALTSLIDEIPALTPNLLELTRALSEYYLCSWGEAIEAALPAALRQGKTAAMTSLTEGKDKTNEQPQPILLHNLNRKEIFEDYLKAIKETINSGENVIFLSPRIDSALTAQKIIKERLNLEYALLHSRQSAQEHLCEWLKVKNAQVKIAIGTRLAVFSPFNKAGLIIMDNEGDMSYKQDQNPHYHAREAAFMRSKIDKSSLIMGTLNPSLETLYLAKSGRIKYLLNDKINFPEVKLIDMKTGAGYQKQKNGLTFQLQAEISLSLQKQEKILVFLNRKGFATMASCPNCHKILRCPRCDVNLIYQFRENSLTCRYCNYKMPAPNLCPDCDASYIRYSGLGAEKLESEFARLFPTARISSPQEEGFTPEKTDIVVSSRPLLEEIEGTFDLSAVISVDNSLNRVDFRAAEKTFSLLLELLVQTKGKLLIQTYMPQHYCFWSLLNKDVSSFYEEELKFRKQLSLPPYSHMILIKTRGKDQDKVKEQSRLLLEKLNSDNTKKGITINPLYESTLEKLRGNFYAHICVKSKSLKNALALIKKHIQDFRHSDIIVSADVDPM